MADSSKPAQFVPAPMLPSDVVRAVLRLFFARGPSAVVWAVWAVVVDAVERLAVALAHVCDEVVKGLPSIANSDPAASISVVMHIGRVCAPVAHSLPDPVFARVASAVLGDRPNLQAPAAFVLPAGQVGHKRHACIAALAQADKGALLTFLRPVALHG